MAKILVVDWEEEERIFYWSVLEDAGHELLFAADGRMALEIFAKNEVDLVVTELYLPELNGLRLIRELRSKDPYIRIMALSEISADMLDLAEDYGACSILYKPVGPTALLAGVERALEAYRYNRLDDWHVERF